MADASERDPGEPGFDRMTVPKVKGWCPGAHRPMMSGDGLVVRVRPFFGALSADQALGLCDLSEAFGNGMLDLTSRANLQIRGVREADHLTLLERLDNLGLIDSDPAIEAHRNVLMPPDWEEGDLTHRLYLSLLKTLPHLPSLPDKMGFALDTSVVACLAEGSADFRFELDAQGGLLLRLDGAERGRRVTEDTAMSALVEIAEWFVQSGGCARGRMRRHIPHAAVPSDWTWGLPRRAGGLAKPGTSASGTYLGAPFGKLSASNLRALFNESGASALRLLTNRTVFVKGVQVKEAAGFVIGPSRLMQVHACPGAPFCPQATVRTMDVAHQLAEVTDGTLHVSGCAKGCAFPRSASATLVGNQGQFDLVLNGSPWDAAHHSGFDPSSSSDLALLT